VRESEVNPSNFVVFSATARNYSKKFHTYLAIVYAFDSHISI